MEVLHCPDNIKVHFAGAECMNQFLAVQELGVQYALYTAFPFVERMVFEKFNSPIMVLDFQKTKPANLIPKYICDTMKHVIQDSGLFTLMFGSRKGLDSQNIIYKWYDRLVEFTLSHKQPVTCVEVDCQKVLGVKESWDLRQRMKNDLPNNRQINVFHWEDGRIGLDRMIEFSDYIAISVPELRFLGKKEFVPNLLNYIKNKKPEIDVHLLGCTELSILKKCLNATSCDSTSYISCKRFGYINNKHVNRINTEKVINCVGKEIYERLRKYGNETNTNSMCVSVIDSMQKYEKCCGNQDYKL